MQVLLAVCRELAVDYNTLPKMLYVLNIKRNMFNSKLHTAAFSQNNNRVATVRDKSGKFQSFS